MDSIFLFIGKNYRFLLTLLFGFCYTFIPFSAKHDSFYWDKRVRPYALWIRLGIGLVAFLVSYTILAVTDLGAFMQFVVILGVPIAISTLAYNFLSRNNASNSHKKVDRLGAEDYHAMFMEFCVINGSTHGFGWVRFTTDQILINHGGGVETCFRKLRVPYASQTEVVQAATEFYNYVMRTENPYQYSADWELKPFYTIAFPGVYVNVWGQTHPESLAKRRELQQA